MMEIRDFIEVKAWDCCYHEIRIPVNLSEGATFEERVKSTNAEEIILKLLSEPYSSLNDVENIEKIMYAYRFTTREFWCEHLYGSDAIEETSWTYLGEPYSLDQLREDLADIISEEIIADIKNRKGGTEEKIKILKEGFGLLVLPGEYLYGIRPCQFKSLEKSWTI